MAATNSGQVLVTSGSNFFYGAANTAFTFTNNGTINVSAGALTIGDGGTDTGAITSVGATIEATGVGSTVTFLGGAGHSFTNNGNLFATGGGVIYFEGNFTISDLGGTIGEGGVGSALNIAGNLNNNATNLPVPDGGGVYTLVGGGTILGGTVASGALTFTSNGTLSGVTLNGNFTVPSGGTFTTNNGTVFQGGTTNFVNSIARVGAGSPGLTIASSETWTGEPNIYASVTGANVLNNGQINVTSGSNFIYGAGNTGFQFTNAGLVNSLTGAALTIGDAGTDTAINGVGGSIAGATGGTVSFIGGAPIPS